MRSATIYLIGFALLFSMLIATASAETMEHSSVDELNGGKFEHTELAGSKDDAAIRLKALGIPDWDLIDDEVQGRHRFGMAFDEDNNAIVVFGGSNYGVDHALSDTWIYWMDTGLWELMNPTIAPPGRYGHNMVYDSTRGTIVMFGGYDQQTTFDDTWTYDLLTNTWTEIDTVNDPDPRYGAAMAYDDVNDMVILFGGSSWISPWVRNDTWALDIGEWTWVKVNTVGDPPLRKNHGASFDSDEGVMVVFGGLDADDQDLNDTWEFDILTRTWTNTTTASPPTACEFPAMTYIGNGLSLMFGGEFDTKPYHRNLCWVYNSSSNTWSAGNTGPEPRAAAGLVYDVQADRAVLFGGEAGSQINDMWEYEIGSGNWTRLWEPGTPDDRWSFGFVYDDHNDRCILFGGYDGRCFNDTWEYDPYSREWTRIETTNAPSPRGWFDMVYDSNEDLMVLFGGMDQQGTYLGDTWEFNVQTDEWSQASTSGPSGRSLHAMAYDPSDSRTVLYGGENSSDYIKSDTWEYDSILNTWYSGGTGPSARKQTAMVYSAQFERIVLFGGSGLSNDSLADTWEYEAGANNWTETSPTTSPKNRTDHRMVYDPIERRVVMYGGMDISYYTNDTWTYYNYGGGVWADASERFVPEPRIFHGLAYVPGLHRTVLYGGYGPDARSDLWEYSIDYTTWEPVTADFYTEREDFTLMYYPGEDRIYGYGGDRHPTNNLYHLDTHDGGFDIVYPWSAWSLHYPYTQTHSCFDTNENRIVVVGGSDDGGYYNKDNGTWFYYPVKEQWSYPTVTTAPPMREQGGIAFDANEGVMILFGGEQYQSGWTPLNDTWAFDGDLESWADMNVSTRPSARYSHVMEYDHVNERIIMHGGYAGGTLQSLGDTWAYYYGNNTWIELGHGPALHMHGSTVDTKRDRMLVFGGAADIYVNTLYAFYFANETWVELKTFSPPSRRGQMDIVYSSADDCVYLAGGRSYDRGSENHKEDLWRLSMEGHQAYGTYTSEPIGHDGLKTSWKTISWALAEESQQFSVLAQVAIDDDGISGTFAGPDGTPGTYFSMSTGEQIDPGISGKYLRYRFYLRSSHSGMTPEIENVVITYETIEEPTVVLHSPNGGEDLIENGSHIITWTATGDLDENAVLLAYTIDGGTSWTNITTATADTGFYNWTVPTVESATALIRITVTDMYGQMDEDVSDMTFAIDPPANWMIPGTGGGTGGTDDGPDGGGVPAGNDGPEDQGAGGSSTGAGVSTASLGVGMITALIMAAIIVAVFRRKRNQST